MSYFKYLRLAPVVAALVLSWPAVAGAAALEQFKSFVANTKAARGQFIQSQSAAPGSSAAAGTESSGRFVFSRPGRFIWSYEKPYEQVLQADGEQLYIYDKDLDQVIVRRLGEALGSSPAAILFGSDDLEKDFVLKELGPRGGLEWLEATPRGTDSTFERIAIGMKDGIPQAMELRDAFGQLSRLDLRNVEKNPPLTPDLFKFSIPEGADVLRQ